MGDANNLTAEKRALLEEQMKAVTPDFLEKKIDEVISRPEIIEQLEDRGLSASVLEDKKPEMVEALQSRIGNILKTLPVIEQSSEDAIDETVDSDVKDFPKMIDSAVQEEITSSIEAADQRIKKKFENASNRLEEASNYLENGERPTDPNSELNRQFEAGVISAGNVILEMRAIYSDAVERNRAAMKDMGELGKKIIEYIDARIAEEEAAAAAQQPIQEPSAQPVIQP